MSELVQVRKKTRDITAIGKDRTWNRRGRLLGFPVQSGEIVLKVKKLVDKEQVWFNTNCWQQGGKDTKQEVQLGPVHNFMMARNRLSRTYTLSRLKKPS